MLVVRASNFVCTVYTNRIVAFWRFYFGSYRLSLNFTFHSFSFSSPNRCAAGNHQDPALTYIPSVILTLIQNRINSFIFRPNCWITNYNEKEYFRDTNSSDSLVCLSASFFSILWSYTAISPFGMYVANIFGVAQQPLLPEHPSLHP